MSEPVVIAVDGGNSKTELALVRPDGSIAALVRGAGCSPHQIGADGCLELIGGLLERAREQAADGHRAAAAVLLVAGADLDEEEAELERRARERGWADDLTVGNDTLAVLRAGSENGRGIAIVCGAGINALAVAPDGSEARFPALGAITGDWGGGVDVGVAALGAAVRAEDGRGEQTALARRVPAHFALASAEEVAFAVHRGELAYAELGDLAPLVFAAAEDGDAVCGRLRERLADEIVAFARAAARRVLQDVDGYDVVLGGSLLTHSPALVASIAARLRHELPAARPLVCDVPPVTGSALIGLERIGAGAGARARLQSEIQALSGDGGANGAAP
ncbi:MAG TPA: BadF/BadG/BcrA/BcrD ATPase family protein [Solirubrobacteraceae bacterium]|nr:BadF/BadG/BcrA/BcrD ATPase family protein [Solirubrobacteraceae bacterium]